MYSLLIQVPFMFGSGTGADPRLGLAIIAMTATMALISPVGGWLVEWLGVRVVVASGGLVATAGVMALGWLPTDASAVAVGACLLLAGLGLGLSTGPANVSAITAAPRHQSAGASATVSMMRYVGSITGTVLLSFVLEGGAGTAARHHAALNVYIVALVASTICGLALPPLEGEGRRRRG
jgi:DHA2 family multidrug resistance protein-like MFS transporter